ncbi:MAG: diphthine--ammonia ligase [Euryarchaeota archaeon]|nr:diphthine--ammonia ligase [Euryarchaeota archaeon]
MRVIVLSSGGKDSCYAVWWSLLKGWDIAGIVTIDITGDDSYTFQLPSTFIASFQATAAGIPWFSIPISGNEQTEMNELTDGISKLLEGPIAKHEDNTSQFQENPEFPSNLSHQKFSHNLTPPKIVVSESIDPIDGLVTGALRSDYQKTRIEKMAEDLGIKSFSPLWHHDPKQHMEDLVHHGFEFILSSVSCDGLGENWIGRRIDRNSLKELQSLSVKHRFSIDGEGGEFETCVLNAPWMQKSIKLTTENVWLGSRGHLEILDVELD